MAARTLMASKPTQPSAVIKQQAAQGVEGVSISADSLTKTYVEVDRHLHLGVRWQLTTSVPIRVGMVIKVGEMQLVGSDEEGRFLMTVSELCRKASELSGGHRAAARIVARSHNFVRKQFLPRWERFNK